MVSVVQRRHDNTWLRAAACTCTLLEQVKWEIFEHLPYSSDPALSDGHLFLHLKKVFVSWTLRGDQETKDMHDSIKGLAASFLSKGILKLVPQYDRYLNLHRDDLEK